MNETLPITEPSADTPPVGDIAALDDLPPVKPTKKKSFANGVASNVKQHTVIVSDISSSMSGPKIDESNAARGGFLSALADPANKDGFLVSVIDFNDAAHRLTLAEPATTIQIAPSSAGGGTSFEAALNEAVAVITEFSTRPNPDGWHYLRPVTVFMSDGQSSASDETISAMHELSDVTAIAFGSDAHQDMLKRISSTGEVHVIGTNGHELRQFLAQVGETMSQSIQTVRI